MFRFEIAKWYFLGLLILLIGIAFFSLFNVKKDVHMIFACPDGQRGKCWHRQGKFVNGEIVGFYTEAREIVGLYCYGSDQVTEWQCDDDSGNTWYLYRGISFKDKYDLYE